jgi:hypothetical protein
VSCDIHDSVSIDVKRDLNLWNTSWGRWDSIQIKFTQLMVVLRHLPFTLENLDQHSGLVVCIGREGLCLLRWNRSVALNHIGHDASSCLDSERQWCYIKKQKFLRLLISLACQDSCLDCCTVCNCFVWVNRMVKCLSVEELGQNVLNLWDPCRSSHQYNFMNLSFAQAGVF